MCLIWLRIAVERYETFETEINSNKKFMNFFCIKAYQRAYLKKKYLVNLIANKS